MTDKSKSDDAKVCIDISEDAKKVIKAFMCKQTTTDCALYLKIDEKNLMIIEEEEFEDWSLERLEEDLLEEVDPFYILYIYHNRNSPDFSSISSHLCFIILSPPGLKPEMSKMHAESKTILVKETKMTKIFECQSSKEILDESIRNHLGLEPFDE